MQPPCAKGKPTAPAAAPDGGALQLVNAPQPTHQHLPLPMPLPDDSAVVFYGVRQSSSDSNVPNTTAYVNPAPPALPAPPPPYAHPASNDAVMSAQNSLVSPPLTAVAAPERHQPQTPPPHPKQPARGQGGQVAAAEGGDAAATMADPTIIDSSDSSGDNSSVQNAPTSVEPMVQRNVYISGLSSRMRSSEFRELCQRFGRVEASKLCIEGPTNPSKGYGFVLFYTEESAAACIAGLQGSYLHGRCLQARLADANATPAQARGQALPNLHPSLPRERRSRRGGAGAAAHRPSSSSTLDPAAMSTSGPAVTSPPSPPPPPPPPAAATAPVPVLHGLPPGTTLLLSPDQAAALQRAMHAQGPPMTPPVTLPPSAGAPGTAGIYYVYPSSPGGVSTHAYGIAPPPPPASASMPPSLTSLIQSPNSVMVPINAAGQPQLAPYMAATAGTSAIATPPQAALSHGAPLVVYAANPHPHPHPTPGRTVVVSPAGHPYITGHAAPLPVASPPPLPSFVSPAHAHGPPPQYILATAPSPVQSPPYATVTAVPYGAVLPPGATPIYPPGYPM